MPHLLPITYLSQYLHLVNMKATLFKQRTFLAHSGTFIIPLCYKAYIVYRTALKCCTTGQSVYRRFSVMKLTFSHKSVLKHYDHYLRVTQCTVELHDSCLCTVLVLLRFTDKLLQHYIEVILLKLMRQLSNKTVDKHITFPVFQVTIHFLYKMNTMVMHYEEVCSACLRISSLIELSGCR